MVLEREWDWFDISENIPISEVYKYPDETWDRSGLSCNKNITIDLIHNLVLPRSIYDWEWEHISQYIQISEVCKYPDKKWIVSEQGYNYRSCT